MRTAKIIFAAWLILTAAASAFAQQGTGPGTFSNVTTPIVTLTPTNPVPTISSATVFPTVQGSTAYFYWIVVNNGTTKSLPGGPFVIPNGPASLSSTVYNVIQFTPLGSGYTYDILRTATSTMPTGACNCAVATGATAGTVNDQSNSLSDYTVTITQQNCLLTNGILSGIENLLLSGCGGSSPTPIVPSGTSGTVQVINVKSQPYNAPGNTLVDGTHIGTGSNSDVLPSCPYSGGGNGHCAYTNQPGEFSSADIGKTMWILYPPQGLTLIPQGTITAVLSGPGSDQTIVTTGGPDALNQSIPPGAQVVGVWGNDDTPALTAAAAAGQSSGATVYFPCSSYMITGPALVQPQDFAGAYSVEGASEECVQLIPSPNMSLTGVASSQGAVISFTAISHNLSNLTIDGEGALFSEFVAGGNPFVDLHGRWQQVSNFQIVAGQTDGPAQLIVDDQDSLLSTISVLNPTISAAYGSSGDMCSFIAADNTVVSNILCSNAVGSSDTDLRIVNVTTTQVGQALTFVGGLVDECGQTTAGNDGALSACTIVTNSQHVAFNNTILWSSSTSAASPPGGAALSVDGTSDVDLEGGTSLGPFNANCGYGLIVASGGVLRISHTSIRTVGASGCDPDAVGVQNSGTIYWNNGNTVTASGTATAFSGNLPVFSTTQVGSVTAGHVAAWGSGGLGQLVDGGTPGQTVLATYSSTLSEDNALTANTVTSILTQAVTMPSSGCPCRADIRYGMYSTIDNQSLTAWVNDGTNSYAGSQTSTTSSAPSGQTGTQITGTYANSANVTFTLSAETSGASTTVKALSAQESLPTFLQITIYSSN